jgi:hypothetical protein
MTKAGGPVAKWPTRAGQMRKATPAKPVSSEGVARLVGLWRLRPVGRDSGRPGLPDSLWSLSAIPPAKSRLDKLKPL